MYSYAAVRPGEDRQSQGNFHMGPSGRSEMVVGPAFSMRVAQRLGREFTIEQAVVVGETAKVPNTKLSSNLGDSRPRRISGFERSPNLTECSEL